MRAQLYNLAALPYGKDPLGAVCWVGGWVGGWVPDQSEHGDGEVRCSCP